MKRRILSMILVLVLAFGVLPAMSAPVEAINSRTKDQVKEWLDSEINAGQPRGDGQCVAFCQHYLDYWGTPRIWADARDWYCPQGWSEVATGNSIYNLQVGDLIVERYSPWGHVMVFYGIENGYAMVVDQNYSPDGLSLIQYPNKHPWWYPFSNTTSVYRPPYAPATPPAAPKVNEVPAHNSEAGYYYISWNAVSGATSYSYYLTEYPEGYAYTTNTRSGVISENYITFYGSELKNGKYSFFVHANNSAGQSPQSNWITFNIYADDYLPVKTEEYDGHIYALYDFSSSWSFARDLCKDMGGHLVTVNSQAEQNFLNELVLSGSKNRYWIGATNFETSAEDVNTPYKWVTEEPFSYTNWFTGEPNFSGERGTRERFAEMRKSMGWQWNDACNTSKSEVGFILEIEPLEKEITATGSFDGHTYYLIDRNTTWSEARAYCEMLGGHLVTVNSSSEEAFLNEFLDSGSRSWYYVGAYRKSGAWIWVDGTTATDIDWNGSLWADHCNYLMKYKSHGRYINLPNTYYPAHDIGRIGFICEVDSLLGHAVTVADYTGGLATLSGITDGGQYSGETSFTVSCTNACVVAYTTDGGATYTRLAAGGSGNTRSFSVDVTQDMAIVVALKGDLNLDGKVALADAAQAKRYCAGLRTLTAAQMLAADVVIDGEIKLADAAQIQRFCSGLRTFEW